MAEAAQRLFAERHVDPDAVRVPAGFRVELAATGLSNPSCLDFDEEGNIFVGEMGTPTASAYTAGRIVRVEPDGSARVIADGFSGSITGLAYHEGAFYAAEHARSSRICTVRRDGTTEILVDYLPGGGDHPTSEVAVAHSGKLYFGQGTRTNSAVVGLDNAAWLARHPELCDVPGQDVTLAGRDFETRDLSGSQTVSTGAFKPFGTPSTQDEPISGGKRCSGSIISVEPDGGGLHLLAWGLRHPFGLAVHPDGRLFCTDIGMQDRGSRPIANGREYIWQIVDGTWYGWPDYDGGSPVTEPRFKPPDGPQPELLLKRRPRPTQKPVASLPAGSGVAKFDFARSPLFGSEDTAFLALTGVMTREAAGPYGFKVVAVDIATGALVDFITNAHPGPASAYRSGALERPIAAKFDRTGEAMYVLDLGVVHHAADGSPQALPNTGVLWRISPTVIA